MGLRAGGMSSTGDVPPRPISTDLFPIRRTIVMPKKGKAIDSPPRDKMVKRPVVKK